MSTTTTGTTVRERPILFSGPMVRAILDGRKTQTRRLVKPQPGAAGMEMLSGNVSPRGERMRYHAIEVGGGYDAMFWTCPYGQPGDRLWVKEACWIGEKAPQATMQVGGYDAGLATATHRFKAYREEWGDKKPWEAMGAVTGRWRPSIHMPRWASRITLEITNVRVQRLNDISDDDAKAEGWDAETAGQHPYGWYRALWDEINGKGSWAANPWVWALTFRRIDHA